MTVTHVAEYRFYDLTDAEAAAIDRVLTRALLENGKQFKQDYDCAFRGASVVVRWNPTVPSDEDKPTKSQLSYARTLGGDLRSAATRCNDTDVVARVQVLLREVQAALQDPESTKRIASNCIDAMTEALADLRFIANGSIAH